MEGNLEFDLPAIWRKAPAERTARFFRVYSAVSLELQRELRRRIPDECFRDPARFENVRLAWPLLTWQKSAMNQSLPIDPAPRDSRAISITDDKKEGGHASARSP